MSNAQFDLAFSELTNDERTFLFERAEPANFSSGVTVIKEDTVPDALYVILEGEVRVTRGMSGIVSAEFAGPLGMGELIGEMSFIDGTPTSATLVASGDTKTLRVGHNILRDLMAKDPTCPGRLYHSLLQVLIRRLREVNTRILLPFA